jgi:hypothetical protein
MGGKSFQASPESLVSQKAPVSFRAIENSLIYTSSIRIAQKNWPEPSAPGGPRGRFDASQSDAFGASIGVDNISQEALDLDVGFQAADRMLDETLVEQVETRSFLLSVTENRFAPGETDGGITVIARDDLHNSPNRGLDG